MKKAGTLLLILITALLFSFARAEEEKKVYLFGNFCFGMPLREVRELDTGGAGLYASDETTGTQRVLFLSQNFVLTLWFQGQTEDSPLVEIDAALYMDGDRVSIRDNRAHIKTSRIASALTYRYAEDLCEKVFGQGWDHPENTLPFAPLLFDGIQPGPLSRIRLYSFPDAGKTDVAAHFLLGEDAPVNYLVCRPAE